MKKLFSLISVLAVMGLGVGLLAACTTEEDEEDNTTVVEPDTGTTHTHSWGEGKVTTEPTCTEEGVMTYTCECGETKTEVIPATGHSWSDWTADTSVVEGETVDAGTHSRVCSACKVEETEPHVWTANYVPAEEENKVSAHYEWDCEVCSVHGEGSSLADIPSSDEEGGVDVTIEVTDASNLSDVLVNGATIVLSPVLEEGAEEDAVPTVELDDTLSVGEGVSATIVVGEGTALAGSDDYATTGSALVSVTDGGSLTLELGEDSKITGNASSGSGNSGADAERYGGLIDVEEGGELVINATGDATIMQEDSAAAVLVVKVGGKCTINGGSYMVDDGSNYTIINDGTLIINDGFFGTTNPKSSLIISGNNNASEDHKEDEKPELYINGGTFVGGKHVVKNALSGVCEITGGYFNGFLTELSEGNSSQDIIDCDGGIIRISGGVFGETEDSETVGEFEHTFQVIAGTESIPSVIEISGGIFYEGSEGFITYGGSSGGKDYEATIYDRVVLTPEMYVSLSDILSATTGEEGSETPVYSVTEQLDEDGVTIVGYEVLDANAIDPAGSTNPD